MRPPKAGATIISLTATSERQERSGRGRHRKAVRHRRRPERRNGERAQAKGVVAIGVPVRDPEGTAVAGLSISMPSVRYDKSELPRLVATLQAAARDLEADLR